ncbi:MAG TPA: hypothetical protein VMP08_07635 [Anaerolineae bacterium]|nr:hypothetical protein [Anaerolineae bacterium]
MKPADLPALYGLPAASSADELAATRPPRASVLCPVGWSQRTRAGKAAVTTASRAALPEDYAISKREFVIVWLPFE